ncbi:gamma carbonic anhydrase family protein [Dokdonella sp. MW10]|uniref:gamma carbonic anhydrase family protein n=1 Tax=Dokdonella sp. MW10 TaxID=2992926 RepID=UPI003F7DCA11
MNIRSYNGLSPRIGLNAYVDPAAVVIGDVELEEDASIWPCAVVRGDVHRIRIGARSNIQDGAVLHVTHDGQYTLGGFPLLVGADVTVGHGAILHACTVQEACLIGMNATVLDGVLVKKHSMIGAGALVGPGKVVGERELWLGNPARRVRELSDQEVEKLYYSAHHYIKIKNGYLKGGVA